MQISTWYFLLVLVFVLGLFLGASAAHQYYQANPVTIHETHTETEYVAPDGHIVFQFTNHGDWSWPATIEFQRVNSTANEWETVFVTTVDRREAVAVPLNRSERHRIKATSGDGERRVLGVVVGLKKDHYEVVIAPCCVDDFS